MLACWRHVPAHRPSAIDIYAILKNNENMIQPLLSCPALAKITDCDTSAEMDMCPAPLKASTIFKKPLLRQSSSIISVDSKYSHCSLAVINLHYIYQPVIVVSSYFDLIVPKNAIFCYMLMHESLMLAIIALVQLVIFVEVLWRSTIRLAPQ